jgi:hypothetical protein
MRALVVYESMFGNTRDIARAVADGIATRMPVDILEVDVAPTTLPADVGLLVVGAPTHAHGLSNAKTRADAANRAGERLVSRGLSLAEWLDVLRPTGRSVATTAFDTRIKGPELLWGSAAKALAKRLSEARFDVIAKPMSFLVGGPTGPQFDRVVAGELERAKAWGADVAGQVGTPAGVV